MRGRVESLAYGAHGIVRVDGKVYFVRHVAPGDDIELEVTEEHRAYAFAEMTALVQAGEARREPPCEYLPRCGGCPWQHIEYEAQLEAKERAVGDLLRRVGRLEAAQVSTIVAAPSELGYRRRLSLRVEDGKVGYFAAASHDLVAVDHCLLAARELDGALPLAQEWIASLSTKLKRLEIAAAAAGRFVFAAQADGLFGVNDDATTAAFLAAHPKVQGLTIRGRGWRHRWGDDRLHVSIGGGESIELHAGNFLQVNAEGNEMMVATVLELAACAPGDRALDLYAGFGNLTFPLARHAGAVLAVERDDESARAGAAHAKERGYEHVTFVAADVAAYLRASLKQRRGADVVVLDPPRSGAADAVPLLLQLAPKRIVYVSCNPSTLARDLAVLSARYRVGRIQPIDFFPQTYHVETVVELVLTDP